MTAYRLRHGYSTADYAKRIGVSKNTIHRYEAGRMPAQPYLDLIVIDAGGELSANDWLGKEARDVLAFHAPAR